MIKKKKTLKNYKLNRIESLKNKEKTDIWYLGIPIMATESSEKGEQV